MRKNKMNLIYMLMLFPIIVNAKTSDFNLPIAMALFMEAFVSLHMSFFVLKPLSMIFSKDNSKKLFWTLFIIRVIVLLIFDIFITTSIALIDFFAVFIGAFIVVPISALITKKSIDPKSNQVIASATNSDAIPITNEALKCSNCGGIIKPNFNFCTNCGSKIDNALINKPKNRVYPNYFDPIYRLTEDKMLEEFINRESTKIGIDLKSKLIPKDILKRKKVFNIIFLILLFASISSIFFHFPIITYIFEIILLFIFYKLTRKYNLIKYLKKEIKSRPSEKISNIIMNLKTNMVEDNSKVVLLSGLLIAILLPLIIFSTPKIIYEKVDNGYAVRFYAFGLSNFKTATIPRSYKGENVVSLRGNTFSNMFFLESVILPDTIIEIRGQAFKNDYNLIDVNIPSKLEYLGGGSFYNCNSLKSISFPDTVTFIGGETFYHATSLESLKLSNNITEIRGDTFEYCYSLKSITIPDKVTRIGGHAFYGCKSLSEVNVTENSKLQEIGSSAFRQCSSLMSITLTKNTYINERAFKESPTIVKRFGEIEENYNNYYNFNW